MYRAYMLWRITAIYPTGPSTHCATRAVAPSRSLNNDLPLLTKPEQATKIVCCCIQRGPITAQDGLHDRARAFYVEEEYV
jgi:hypothetical protein